MKVEYIVAVFAAIYFFGRLAFRYPNHPVSRVLLSPFGPESDFASPARAERRRSARVYFAVGLVLIGLWLTLNLLVFRFGVLSFETPWVMGVMFGSFLLSITCLGAAVIFRFFSPSRNGSGSGST